MASIQSRPSGVSEPVLAVRGLSKRFAVGHDFLGRPRDWLWAVDGVDLDVWRGETLAIVGESGCGKSTLARLIMRLVPASSGSVRFERTDMLTATEPELRRFRGSAQMVFQDPGGSLNDLLRVEDIVLAGLAGEGLSGPERRARVAELLELVELPGDAAERFPHEFSGGQRQRISIARALAAEPTLLIADEPVSTLDVSVQSAILNLFMDLQRELDLTLLFVSHDLSVVRHVADRVAVMYLGRVVEQGPTKRLFDDPRHPYTQALRSCVPRLAGQRSWDRIVLEGDATPAAGSRFACGFSNRCFRSVGECREAVPILAPLPDRADHRVACFNSTPVAVAAREALSRDPPRGLPAEPTGRTDAPVAAGHERVAPRSERAPGIRARVERRMERALPFAQFFAARLLRAALLLLIASVLVFSALSGVSSRASESTQSFAAEYVTLVKNLLSGDPGTSLVSGAPIGEIVKSGVVKTLTLGGAAAILVYSFAIPLGVLAARRRDSPFDHGIRFLTVLAMAVPGFFLAVLVIQLFAVKLGWLPAAGPGGFSHLVLPAGVLAVEALAINLRLTRSSVLDELARPYVQALRARGLGESRVVWVHGLRNGLAPVIAFMGVSLPLIFGYTMIIEVIFRFQGLGFHLVQAVLRGDFPLAQTLALIFTAAVIISNLLADIAHRIVDPRLREQLVAP